MPGHESSTQCLIDLLDVATESDCMKSITSCVKDALVKTVGGGELRLDQDCLTTCPDSYGRRLLHRDPKGRYTVLAMIWAQGQGTPIHDHGDKWCVECVYQGEILVRSYDLCPGSDPDHVTFEFCGDTNATIGEAGALIPPHDYHVIENKKSETAVTIHVYGGEMDGCHVFEPIEGSELYVKQWKRLCYSD